MNTVQDKLQKASEFLSDALAQARRENSSIEERNVRLCFSTYPSKSIEDLKLPHGCVKCHIEITSTTEYRT